MLLKNVRSAYPRLFTPRSFEGGAPKYELTLLIPKTDTETVQKIKQAIEAAKVKKWPGGLPETLRSPVKDGDKLATEAFKGHWILAPTAIARDDDSGRPGVVLPNLKPAGPTDLQSGDFVNVDINPFGYDTKGNKGVGFGLNNVQLVSKGDQIGGGRSRPESVFDEIETDEFSEGSGYDDDGSPF